MLNQFLTIVLDDSNITIDSGTVHLAELESDAGPVRPTTLAATTLATNGNNHYCWLVAFHVRFEFR